MNDAKLTIELVPKTSFYSNVRSEVSQQEWDFIRNVCYNRANKKCEICGDTGKNQGYSHNVECHEIWDYNDNTFVQKLSNFIALCPMCHKVKHIGLSTIKGEKNICIEHLKKINGWSTNRADKYLKDVIEIFAERSQHNWELDISLIKRYGLSDELDDIMKMFKK